MILDSNGDHAKPEPLLEVVKPERVLNEITREDVNFTVKPVDADGWTVVVGMLNIGSAQKFKETEYPDASPRQLVEEAALSIFRGAGNRIYGKVRADALTASTEILKLLNQTVGVQSGDILKIRALLEPLVEAGSDLSGPSE